MVDEPENPRNGPTGAGEEPAPSGGQDAPGGAAGDSRRVTWPVLTERQRAEARRQRQARQRRRRRAQPGNALSRGVRATGHEITRTARFIARAVAATFEASGPLGRKLAALAAGIAAGLATVAGLLASLAGAAARGFGRALVLLDRTLTPRRAILLAGLLAGLSLAASQFMDFRATEIGQPGYSGIEDVTNAPRVDVNTPLHAHWAAVLAAVGLALIGLAGFARTGRRRFALLAAFAGCATVAVTLGIDLPAGLNTGDAELSYSGVSAVLLTGFWLQLAAGAVLAASGMLLWLEGRLPARVSRRGPTGDTLAVARRRPA